MQEARVDLTRSTEWAWKALHERLCEQLETLAPGDELRLEVLTTEEERRGTPYVSVRREGDVLLAETPGDRSLKAAHRVGESGRRRLRALGWRRDKGDRCYRFRAGDRYVDQVAHLCISSLRDVHRVLHPAFVAGDVEVPEDPTLPRAARTDSSQPLVAVFPPSRQELEALVLATLAEGLGHPPEVDEDGDVPFSAGTAVVFVRVDDHAPVIRIFAELVVDIGDADRAAAEVEALNRTHGSVKFVLEDDRIQCVRDLDAWPYAPAHLRSALSRMCELCSRIDGEVAERVRGRVFLAPKDEVEPMPPALDLVLSGDPILGRPRPELVSKLCDDDPAQLRRWLRRAYDEQQAALERLQAAVTADDPRELRDLQRDLETSTRRYQRLTRALRFALRRGRSSGG